MASLATGIPPELFDNILSFVGDQFRLYPFFDDFNPAAWREETKHLSVCAATCVHWARLTRPRMFNHIVLRSYQDLHRLQSLLACSSSPRIESVGNVLTGLTLLYTLGDHPWFHGVAGLKASVAPSLCEVFLRIRGPATPAFIAASARQSVLHPLFFSAPRMLSMRNFGRLVVSLHIENIHLSSRTILYNLQQDCFLLRPWALRCANVTWDHYPGSAELKLTCHTNAAPSIEALKCTDHVLLLAMAHSVPNRPFPPRPQGPHISVQHTSNLLDVMRITRSWLSEGKSMRFEIQSIAAFRLIQSYTGVSLPPETDLQVQWNASPFSFKCFAYRPLNDASGVRFITCITINFPDNNTDNETQFSYGMNSIDWSAFLRAVQQFPDLRQIAIQFSCDRFSPFTSSRTNELLVDFIDHLGDAWIGLGGMLGIYCGSRNDEARKTQWVQIDIETVVAKIRQRREPEKELSDQLESDLCVVALSSDESGSTLTDLNSNSPG